MQDSEYASTLGKIDRHIAKPENSGPGDDEEQINRR